MITLHHHKFLSQPEVKPDILISYQAPFRTIKPAQFLNNLHQFKESDNIYQTPQYNQQIPQEGAQTDRIQEFPIHLPKIHQNSSLPRQQPITLMPESKHSQLKTQLENIFLLQNVNSETNIALPGLSRRQKESHKCFKMIEEQISFPNPQVVAFQRNRFRKRRIEQTTSQTNLDSFSQIETENSQLEDPNKEKKVEFLQQVRVINLQNGRVATEVIKEEGTEQVPVKPKRKFVSQKTRFIPDNQKK